MLIFEANIINRRRVRRKKSEREEEDTKEGVIQVPEARAREFGRKRRKDACAWWVREVC